MTDELPRDPDFDSVPDELLLLSGLGAPVIVLDESGVSHDTLVVVPQMWAHARRAIEDE